MNQDELISLRIKEANKLFDKLKQGLEQYKDLLDINIEALTLQTAVGYAAFIAMATSKYIADTMAQNIEEAKGLDQGG